MMRNTLENMGYKGSLTKMQILEDPLEEDLWRVFKACFRKRLCKIKTDWKNAAPHMPSTKCTAIVNFADLPVVNDCKEFYSGSDLSGKFRLAKSW
jgi:hypothetical protein